MVILPLGIRKSTIRGYRYSDIWGVVASTILHRTCDKTWGDVCFRMPRSMMKWRG
jgi:hypothetical protein